MFGFIIGIACLIGLYKVLKVGHYGHGPWGARGDGAGAGRRRWMFRWLFQRLDTSPGQEKVFNTAADDLEGRVKQIFSELEQLRRDVAKSVRGEHFDAAAVRESFARQRAHLDTLEEAVVGHLGKIHESLDPKQRGDFAELIESGPHYGRHGHRCGGHPYGRFARAC